MFLMSVAAWAVMASVITAALYMWDKRQAQKSKSRISERTLLIWSAIGGWPGAMITGRIIRHKTQKLSYRVKFALCVVFNVSAGLLIWYFRTNA